MRQNAQNLDLGEVGRVGRVGQYFLLPFAYVRGRAHIGERNIYPHRPSRPKVAQIWVSWWHGLGSFNKLGDLGSVSELVCLVSIR